MVDNYITIEEFLKILRKRLRLILIMIILFTAASVILSFYVIKPKYEASTKFFIGKESIGENQYYSQNDVIMYQNLMKTYSEIIKTPDILASSIKTSNLNIDVDDVTGKLKVVAIADTQILEVSYRSVDTEEAKKIINSLTNEFIKISKELVPNGNVKVLQKVRLSENPVTPNKKINVAIGLFSGMMIGVICAFVLEILDKTVRDKEELENDIDLPIIGELPLTGK
ncbi:capsular biosynthesis protein [Clostridium tertium]|uniref:Capsular polysaccharide type 8 biosynthesis protein cap8A n=1 Tax=Clostridium tertium TaxID=1559 RepID=A0A6N2ZPZ7_9CLOT